MLHVILNGRKCNHHGERIKGTCAKYCALLKVWTVFVFQSFRPRDQIVREYLLWGSHRAALVSSQGELKQNLQIWLHVSFERSPPVYVEFQAPFQVDCYLRHAICANALIDLP